MVQLGVYDSAVFLADMAYVDSNKSKHVAKFSIGKDGSIINNPNYVEIDSETSRVNKWKYDNLKREFIINYLSVNYPDTNYAKKYAKYTIKQTKELMYPTEESKKCEYLDEDGRHCNLKRTETSCYTCCFICFTPKMCDYTNCPILPDDRKPKKNKKIK